VSICRNEDRRKIKIINLNKIKKQKIKYKIKNKFKKIHLNYEKQMIYSPLCLQYHASCLPHILAWLWMPCYVALRVLIAYIFYY